MCVCVFSAKFVHFLFLKLAYTQHYTLVNNGDHFKSPLTELANSEVYNIIYRYMNIIYRVSLVWIHCDLFNQPLAGGYLGIAYVVVVVNVTVKYIWEIDFQK